jgi:phosphoribosylformylglycinamidine (FGAM) synthase PurS component
VTTKKTYFVRILPRPEVLDVQGRAVHQMLKSQSYPVKSIRVGRLIEVVLDSGTANESEVLKKVIKEGLYNPLVEVAEVEGL